MKTKAILLCTVALTLGAYSAHAESYPSGPRYTPRPAVSNSNYTAKNHMEDRIDAKSYKEYEERELCQNYRKPPRNYADGCVNTIMKKVVATTSAKQAATPTPVTQKSALPVVRSYTVLFDLDKSDIRSEENKTLDQAMNEIDKYHPKQVTVTGYTDSSGKAEYNQTLSRKREQSVSSALLTRGIKNQSLDRKARGEYEQAVNTADEVQNQKNRRVVIDFRR